MLGALSPKKRGPKPKPVNPLERRVKELERENKRLKKKLEAAEVIIEVQKKSPGFWASTWKPGRTRRKTDGGGGSLPEGRGSPRLPGPGGIPGHLLSLKGAGAYRNQAQAHPGSRPLLS